MKSFIVVIIIFVSFHFLFSQNKDITLYEREMTEVCGRYLIFDGIYVKSGHRLVIISNLASPKSKPIRGGYVNRDSLDISKSCKMFIVDVEKHGIGEKGYITLSKKPPVYLMAPIQTRLEVKEGESLYYDEPEYMLTKVFTDEKGNDKAEVKINRKDLDTIMTFTEGELICWSQGVPFEITKIDVKNKLVVLEMKMDYDFE